MQDEAFVVLDATDAVWSQANGFRHGVHRNAEHLAAGLHHHDVQHRNVHGKVEADRRADTDAAFQRNTAADALDRGADHIHADAASRNIGDLRRRRKSGRKNQVQRLLVRQCGQFVRRQQAPFGGLAPDHGRIDAAAVVDDLYDEAIAHSGGLQSDGRRVGLACRTTLLRCFDAVVERVAYEMHQRLKQQIDDRLVGFGGLAARDEVDALVETLRHVANEPGKRAEHLRHRHHPQLQDRRVQFAGKPLHSVVLVAQCADKLGSSSPVLAPLGEMSQAVLHHQKLAGEIDQRVDLRFIDAKRSRRGAGWGLLV